MPQEAKPIDDRFFGGQRSWRDEARLRLIQALGPKYGELLGEGLLGESEEEKYLEFLQRNYGSELPRDEEGKIDVPLSRPMSQAFTDMSDIGAADKILMMLSAGSSVYPKLAATAAGTETTALLGDAAGEFRKDNPLGGGIMTATAALPYGLNRAFRGTRQAQAEESPLLSDPSRRQFVKGLGAGIAGLGVMASPLGTLMRATGKVMGKVSPTKFLNKQKPMYDAIKSDAELLDTTKFAEYLPEEYFPHKGFSPKIKQIGKENYKVEIKRHDDDTLGYDPEHDLYKAQNKIQMDFFEENGFTKKDLLNIEEDGASYMLREKGVTSHNEAGSRNADPGTYKRYDIYEEPELKIINEDLQKIADDFYDPIKNPQSSPTMTIAQRNTKMAKITGKSIDEFDYGIPDDVASQINFGPKAYSTGSYVETFKIDGVPVVSYGHSHSLGSYHLKTIPKREALLRNAQ